MAHFWQSVEGCQFCWGGAAGGVVMGQGRSLPSRMLCQCWMVSRIVFC